MALTSMALLPLGALGAVAAPTAAESLPAKAEKKVIEEFEDGGKTTFWVNLRQDADLTGANRLTGKSARGAEVLRSKKETAEESQADVLSIAEENGAEARSFWIINTVQVTATEKVAEKIAELPEVESIRADRAIKLDEPTKGERRSTVSGVEWNIDAVNAPDVWTGQGVRGEGVVVANIDTGVDHTHAAVAGSYRGRNGDGTFSHDHNWFDPASVCAGGAPCDNNGHGTHTMGTMVGDDGGANQIGVAPGATWIAAKGCESSSCSDASLLASGEWIVAPTDRAGDNPRPDLAPDVVNNSWGGNGFDDWYQEIVDAWRAAGIFPAFSNGNSGSACSTSGSPGTYTSSYSTGAFDANGAIASFSSRGPGEAGTVKPDIAAPGVGIRSSVPGGYSSYNGTSMASPHTAGAVALIWSASPQMLGDVDATEALLGRTAVDTENLQCGGTAERNNVFGEGKLDALAAVENAPRGAVGSLSGTVTSGGEPLAGARIAVDGPIDRSVTSGADGAYELPVLSVGEYTLTASKYGYLNGTAQVTVTEGATASAAIEMDRAPSSTVSGTVSSASGPVAGATVSFTGTPVSVTTEDDGTYSAVVPHGDHTVEAVSSSLCLTGATEEISVGGDLTLDITLPARKDSFGTACSTGSAQWIAGDTPLALTGDDAAAAVTLPFSFPLYGTRYGSGHLNTNGVLTFGGSSTAYSNVALPAAAAPNAALYPFWDDLAVTATGSVHTKSYGEAPNRKFLVEWRDVAPRGTTTYFSFSVELTESGDITYRYKDVPAGNARLRGNSATVGIENATGTVALQYSHNQAVLEDGLSISFRDTSARIHGVVTDANDGLPVDGATVEAGGVTAVTGANGGYTLRVPGGENEVVVRAPAYGAFEKTVEVGPGELVEVSASLATGAVSASAEEIGVVVPPGEDRERSVGLANAGSATDFTVTEDADWLTLEGATGTLAKGAGTEVGLAVSTSGLTAGQVYTTEITIHSASGRAPEFTVPVTLVVPGYSRALDAGAATAPGEDSDGASWSADREYRAGSYGWIGRSGVVRTSGDIAGTKDDARFATAREGALEYRFDDVVDGVYEIEVDFAEIGDKAPGKRVFDVMAEGRTVVDNLDIALETGRRTALTKTFRVTVDDGRLNLRFVAVDGKSLVNALKVTERPDLG
ncbi:S8 family serine peptidase [Streptomyces chilikensis]|uniref:S8 family serine peptidase n=1 Tax=Streptomyces chilikensis TaxID=1194079 RepID=UPI0023F7347F|nr:S8 family serine peptidase [Streptomyces chilikensis]